MANTRRLRIFHLLRKLCNETAMSAREIRQYLLDNGFECSQKTVERDLEYLSIHYGISSEGEYPIRFFASGSFDFKQELSLDFSVIETLHMALQNLKETSHDYFEEQVKKAELALEEALSPDINEHLESVRHKYHFDYGLSGKPVDSNVANIKKVLTALREEKTFSCTNNSPYKEKGPEKKLLAPLFFVLSSGMPYLIAKDLEDDSVPFKRFRLTRLNRVKIKDHFDLVEYNVEYDPSSFLGGWKGKTEIIRIHGDKKVGTFFKEKSLHPTQKVEKLNEDEFLITFKAPLSSELSRILAGFGGSLYNVSPQKLSDQIQDIWSQGQIKKKA